MLLCVVMKKGRGYVYKLEYHLVWSTKYRHQVLKGYVADTLESILRDIAINNGLEVVSLAIQPDHVHILVGTSPQHSIPNFVKALKGASARRLFQLHPDIKKSLWGGHLWNPSYCVLTMSENTSEQIKRYIEEQEHVQGV